MTNTDLEIKAKTLFPHSESMQDQWVKKTQYLLDTGKHALSPAYPKFPSQEDISAAILKVKALTVPDGMLTDDDAHAFKAAGLTITHRPDLGQEYEYELDY